MALLLPFAFLGVTACDDGTGPEPLFTLVFAGDETFHTAHGGQSMRVALVSSGGTVVTQEGVVSEDAVPSFSFTFEDALEAGQTYEVHYWIDSNFGDGTEGVCDAVDVDHQWSADLGSTTDGSVTQTESHDPTAQTAVCSTFE